MKCQSHQCSAEARYRYNWPGQGLHFACGPCTAHAAAIMKILGYELPLQRLEDIGREPAPRLDLSFFYVLELCSDKCHDGRNPTHWRLATDSEKRRIRSDYRPIESVMEHDSIAVLLPFPEVPDPLGRFFVLGLREGIPSTEVTPYVVAQ